MLVKMYGACYYVRDFSTLASTPASTPVSMKSPDQCCLKAAAGNERFHGATGDVAK
jgi:hypothetical protein